MNKKAIERIKREGFSILDFSNIPEKHRFNGVILSSGEVVLCDYMQHRWVYPILYELKLVNHSDWIDDDSAIHISSGQLNGKVAFDICNGVYDEISTEEQRNTLFKLKNHIDGYPHEGNIPEMLFEHVKRLENKGGKYNGLYFLKKYYNIRIPHFSQNIEDFNSKFCIRTSPKYSIPGLLNSKFDMNKNSYNYYIQRIKEEFEQFKHIKEGNELHWFFQEQLDGINGVCHYRDNKFTYSSSLGRGDIVKGKKGKQLLSKDLERELREICKELAEDFDKSIQLEFIVYDNILYILQFRLLNNEPNNVVSIKIPKNTLYIGNTFSYGTIDLNPKDILIVKEDGESNLLLGKKALIVEKNVEFSHLLALSKALGIPSMYGTGKIDFKKRKKVKFVAYNKKSWII